MKGLLLKETYMALKYCRSLFIIIAVFAVVSAFQPDESGSFFAVYPCLLSGMIPMTLISYDERDKWNEYVFTLPYTRTQMVSSKYIIGMICSLISVLVILIMSAVSGYSDMLSLAAMLCAISFASPSVLLPFVFKYGAEKGRILYYFIIGIVCAVSFIFMKTSERTEAIDTSFSLPAVSVSVLAVSVLMFACSWLLSVKFYNSREI